MNWYYVRDSQQTGPVSDTEFEALVAQGTISADTLVWREGMANWQPYSQVAGPSQPAAPLEPGSVPAQPTTGVPATGQVTCSQCNGVFPTEEAIQYGGSWVCASCKPVFLQKLREGASLAGAGLVLNYAGFWIRFVAVFIDGLLLGVVNLGLGLLAGLSVQGALGLESDAELGLQLVLSAVQIGIGISYETLLIGKYGATLGKMAMGLRVVTPDGGSVSYARALGRYFGKILSYMICAIGFIIAAFDEEKRALHDHICSTRVIKSR